MPTAVAVVPAIGMLASIPLYLYAFAQPTELFYSVARPVWAVGVFLQFTYIGSMYTIGQGVVSQRSRASAIAILLLIVALLGNGLGPQAVGSLSDVFMSMELNRASLGSLLSSDLCRNAAEVAKLVAELGASGPADMGKVMGAAKQRFAGNADMGQVSAAVKQALSK